MIRLLYINHSVFVFLHCLSLWLRASATARLKSTAGSVEEARMRMGQPNVVDVMVVDVRLPDGSGLDPIQPIPRSPPGFLVLSALESSRVALEA